MTKGTFYGLLLQSTFTIAFMRLARQVCAFATRILYESFKFSAKPPTFYLCFMVNLENPVRVLYNMNVSRNTPFLCTRVVSLSAFKRPNRCGLFGDG